MAYQRKTIIQGVDDYGTYTTVPTTTEGHLEVAIRSPSNPFGSVHTENLVPIFQGDAVYGVNTQLVRLITGQGGYVSENDSQLELHTSTGVGGNATLQSRKRLRYRPGQGVVNRFTAVFTSGVADSFQVVGAGHAEDGLYFGYSGQNFGVLHSFAGRREVRVLGVSSAATATGNVGITLGGVNFTTPVSASSNIARTVYEISTGVYAGWAAEPIQSGVVFLSSTAGPKNGAFLLSGNTSNAAGTFATARSGVALTEHWTLQQDWNALSVNRESFIETFDPSKGNVYQIQYQYLGYGDLTFQVEYAPSGANPNWMPVHTIRYPNTNTAPSFRNPSFPFTASVYSFGSTTALDLKTPSFAGFLEGERRLIGPSFTHRNISTSVSTTIRPLFTIKNNLTFRSKANQCVVYIQSINAASKHNTGPVEIFIIKNATLIGNPIFTNYSENSCTSEDTEATSVAYSENNQLVFSFSLAESGQEVVNLSDFGFELQPGESMSFCARTAAGTASYLSISANTREDQ